jgi:hypothetical protein
MTASRISQRRFRRESWWMSLLIQYKALVSVLLDRGAGGNARRRTSRKRKRPDAHE